jgi:Ca2+:H+ antiporter
MKLNWLLIFVPLGLGLHWAGAHPILIFLASALAIVPLAALMGDATEVLASYIGPTYGGLLNATLGNAPEIIIGLFALQEGLVDILKASLTGSIIGNLLFGLGLSLFAGGLKCGGQEFDSKIARRNAGLLLLAAIGLVIPAVFHASARSEQEISVHIAAVLFLVYCGSLILTFRMQKAVFGKEAAEEELEEKGQVAPEPVGGREGWSRNQALAILGGVTIALAGMSEVLTDAIQPASVAMGLTPLFAGVFLLAMVGNAAELFNAVRFARANQVELALGVTVGASIQVALLVAPVLVFFGLLIDQDMNLLFSQFEIVAVMIAVVVTRDLTLDGRSTWFDGLLLIGVYCILGFGFFYATAPVPVH